MKSENEPQKPIYEKSLHPFDKTKKHWRKLRTEPYKPGDRLGFKLFGDQIHFFDDVRKQRGISTTKFIAELISITVQWTKEQINLGKKPFCPAENISYRGLHIAHNAIGEETANNINWLYEYMNSVRVKKQSYEHCLKDAVMWGIRLLWEYNVAQKNIKMVTGDKMVFSKLERLSQLKDNREDVNANAEYKQLSEQLIDDLIFNHTRTK